MLPKSGFKRKRKCQVRTCNFGLGPGSGFKMRPVYNSALRVKSIRDISTEPVRGQKIEEHVVPNLDLRNVRIGLVYPVVQ